MVAALTFDDGPSQWTAPILDLLGEWGYHATFFVLGAHIAGNEALLQRMRDDGHEVGNHGWTHRHLTTLTAHEAEDELWRTTEAIRDATGQFPTLWWSPYLDSSAALEATAANMGLTYVGCDVIPGDWNLTDPQQIAQNVLSELKDGDIVLLHDGVPPMGANGTQDRGPTVAAVALLLATPGVTWCRASDL